MAPEEMLQVEVAYARSGEQIVIAVSLPLGTTVSDAIARSGIIERCPELRSGASAVGIYGKVVALGTPLRAGDRVEIYRPLIADPKLARRRRAAESP